jgi:hypothetical protein
MNTIERADLGTLVSDVLAYYGKPTSEFTLGVWWNACKPFSLEQVRKALTAHATDAERGQFPPKVADVVRILAGTVTDRAALAWGKTHEAMAVVGAYQDAVFDDPAIHAAVEDCGGWPKMCRTDLKELSYLQHRFCAAYKAYAERGTFDYPRRLGGDRSPDSEYEKKRLPLPRPAFVGDPLRCQMVFDGGGAGKTAITYQPITKLLEHV